MQDWLNSVAANVKKGSEYQGNAKNATLLSFHDKLADQFGGNVTALKDMRTTVEQLLDSKKAGSESADWAESARSALTQSKQMTSALTMNISAFGAVHRVHYKTAKKAKSESTAA